MTGSPPRVFLARLAGLSVLDPSGDSVGRLRDVVVSLGLDAQLPRVHGLVVEVQPRRRVFLPMGRVLSLDTGAVIVTGKVDLRRFDQRASETLALSELLDRKVTVTEEQLAATIVDLGAEQTRARDWVVTKVAVSVRPATGLRRRAHTQVLAWNEISGLRLPDHAQGAANLLAALGSLRPADLAGTLQSLSPKRRAEIAAALDDERLADVLEELPEDDQVEILAALEQERAADVLEAMAPDDAADLLNELPAEEAERLLGLMEPDEAASVRRLLTYPEDTAGGLMTSEPVVLPPDASVAEALARVRNPEVSPALASLVFVCRPPTETPTGRYLGMAHIQRLLREPPASLVSGVVDTDIDPIRPEMGLPELTSYLATYNLVAVPVVDDADHLIGAVTVDDVLDHLLPDDWREHQPRAAADEAGQRDAS